MIVNEKHLNEINSIKQTIQARVELYNGSTLERVCTCGDILSEFTVEKSGENKFFGYGICQKIKTKLIDINRDINISKKHTLEAAFSVENNVLYPFPNFYIEEVERDETSNLLILTAYDALYNATTYTISDLELPANYTIYNMAAACASILGVPFHVLNVDDDSFNLYFTGGANFLGTENIRQVLNAIAEATQTIYYIDNEWRLTFKRLDRDSSAAFTIDKNKYIELVNNGERMLEKIVHTTELEDNVSPFAIERGETQYIRDNPFWELRDDIATIVDKAQAAIGGLIIGEFDCNWVGNYLLELGDKINLVTEDDSIFSTFVLDDTIIFDGTLMQNTKWSYDENGAETINNPTSLGEAIKQTYARVDKANRKIELLTGESASNKSSIAALQINTNSIAASVESIEQVTTDALGGINQDIANLTKEVSTKIDADGVKILIEKELSNGVDKVKTSTTGYTFDDNGLAISKSDSEISTIISEDGMRIFKNASEVLVADNQGVKAEDLHATTYLIIGDTSRIETVNGRACCFWIGK